MAIWIPWRILTSRQRRGDIAREIVIAILFGWSLIVVALTLFPLQIIFYDWHARFNLIPFASIFQLMRDTPITVAFENIVGNLVLFIPLGFLLPMLFKQLRRLGAVLWRMALVSVVIEAVQLITGVRAVDVDDVILNVAGAAIGFSVFLLLARLWGRSRRATRLLDRIGADPDREPLLLPMVPILLTTAIAVPVMVSTLVSATLTDGPNGIIADATSIFPGSSIAARADEDRFVFLILWNEDAGVSGIVSYEKVLPGRFTRGFWGEPVSTEGSWYSTGVTDFNDTQDETITGYAYGSNEADATRLIVRSQAFTTEFELPDTVLFVVGFTYVPDPESFALDGFTFQFLDESGNDVTSSFVS